MYYIIPEEENIAIIIIAFHNDSNKNKKNVLCVKFRIKMKAI